jgi:ATP synthase protein I
MEASPNKKEGDLFSKEVSEKEKRKLKAQHENSGRVWAGLGMFGMVGWSVAVPTLLGAALGIWLDKKYPESFSWTLTFLIIGLFSGCVIAWYWVSKNNNDE